jgi:hypothetical protein
VARPESNVRPAQADAEFIAECRMPDASFAAPFALAVRREVARRAGVAPGAVHAADRLPEEWGDLFFRANPDAVEFMMELEEEFGVSIPDWAGLIFIRESVSVADLASDLCGAVLGRGRRGERPRSWGEVARGMWAWLRGRGHGAPG